MEMADTIVITKADRDNINKAKVAKTEYKNALHLFPATVSGWIPEVVTASALTGEGVENVWEIIEKYISFTKNNGYFKTKRAEQAKYRMHETIIEKLKANFYENENIKKELKNFEKQILNDIISPYFAAKILLEKYYKK